MAPLIGAKRSQGTDPIPSRGPVQIVMTLGPVPSLSTFHSGPRRQGFAPPHKDRPAIHRSGPTYRSKDSSAFVNASSTPAAVQKIQGLLVLGVRRSRLRGSGDQSSVKCAATDQCRPSCTSGRESAALGYLSTSAGILE
jgi:hypothetical protein